MFFTYSLLDDDEIDARFSESREYHCQPVAPRAYRLSDTPPGHARFFSRRR